MNAQTPLAIDDFVDISNRLSDLMTAEVTSLRAMRPKDIAPLQEEKTALTERYAQYLRIFRSDESSIVLPAEPGAQTRLREAVGRVSGIARTNHLALEAARTVNERLVRFVSETVTAKTNSSNGYGATGSTAQQTPVRGDHVVSVTLNTQV